VGHCGRRRWRGQPSGASDLFKRRLTAAGDTGPPSARRRTGQRPSHSRAPLDVCAFAKLLAQKGRQPSAADWPTTYHRNFGFTHDAELRSVGSPRSVSDEDAGMTAFVAKPVRAAELLEVLNAVL